MKALILSIAIQMITFSALAVYIPGWDRPLVQSSEVEIFSADGEFADVQNLSVMFTRNDSTGKEKLFVAIDEELYEELIQQAVAR